MFDLSMLAVLSGFLKVNIFCFKFLNILYVFLFSRSTSIWPPAILYHHMLCDVPHLVSHV